MFSDSCVNKLIVVKNARLHQNNNEKSINIGETTYITFNLIKSKVKQSDNQFSKVENWLKSLKKEDIEILEVLYIEATEKLKILSVDQALKLKLNRKPELYKIKACILVL